MLARDPDGAAVIVPTAFAPEYNHEVYLETLKKIAAMDLDLLGFGHFGAIDDPAPALQAAAQKAEWLHGLVLELINETKTRDQVLDLLEADFGPALISVYDNPQRMRVAFKSLISGARQSLERKLN